MYVICVVTIGASVSRTITTRRPLSSVDRNTSPCATVATGASANTGATLPAAMPQPSKIAKAIGFMLFFEYIGLVHLFQAKLEYRMIRRCVAPDRAGPQIGPLPRR